MKTKIILPMILIVLIGIVGFVYAKMIPYSPDGYNHNVELSLQKGWNLILATPILEREGYADDRIAVDSEIKQENIKAVYYYSRDKNKYLQMYPNAQEYRDYYLNSLSQEDEAYLKFSPVLVYTDKTGTLKYSRVDVPKYYEVALENGWNFLTITPEMSGKSLNEMKGSCNIEKAYLWDPIGQQWGTILNLLDDKNILTTEAEIGDGFIIRVTDDCAFGTGTGNINPPILPP